MHSRTRSLIPVVLSAFLTCLPTAAAAEVESAGAKSGDARLGTTSTGEVVRTGPGWEIRRGSEGLTVSFRGYVGSASAHVLRADGEAIGVVTPVRPDRAELTTTDERVLRAQVLAVDGLVPARSVRPTQRRGRTPFSSPWGARALHPLLDVAVLTDTPVKRARYDLGESALEIAPGRHTEVRGELTWPATWGSAPAPLVIILHGQHRACVATGDGPIPRSTWPCEEGSTAFPSHEGYRLMADELARSGFVVSSIRAGGVNTYANGLPDLGASARAALIATHIRTLQDWSARGGAAVAGDTGAVSSEVFRGRLDPSRVGLVGHSRGGEGAVAAAVRDEARGRPLGIQAVVAITPTNFGRWTLRATDLGVLLAGCDGDVSDFQGAAYLADAARNAPGGANRVQVLVPGLGHNGFNTTWAGDVGGEDRSNARDPRCLGRSAGAVPSADATVVGALYTTALLRRSLQDDHRLDPMLEARPRVPGALRRTALEISAERGRPVGSWSAAAGTTIRGCRGAGDEGCHPDAAGPWASSALAPNPHGELAQLASFSRTGTLQASLPSLAEAHRLSLQAWAPPGSTGVLQLRDRAGRSFEQRLTLPRSLVRPGRSGVLLSETQVDLASTGLRAEEIVSAQILLRGTGASGRLVLSPLRAEGRVLQRPLSIPYLTLELPGDEAATLAVPSQGVTTEGGEGASVPATLRLSAPLLTPDVVGVEVHEAYGRDAPSGAVRRHRLLVEIPAGVGEVPVALPTGGDTWSDYPRSVTISLTGAQQLSLPHPLSILEVRDDDPVPEVSCESVTGAEGETVQVSLRSSAPSNPSVYVYVEVGASSQVQGEDFRLGGGESTSDTLGTRLLLEIEPGRQEEVLPLHLLRDSEVEGEELAELRCWSSAFQRPPTPTAQLRILDHS